MTASAGESEVLLATKLFPPRRRAALVARPRLLASLRRAVEVPLALLVAPAGWGKTTVVMEWLEHDRLPAGWVSLDLTENDPKRFWSYLLAAVRQVLPGVGVEAQRRLEAAGSEVIRDVLPRLINDVINRSPLRTITYRGRDAGCNIAARSSARSGCRAGPAVWCAACSRVTDRNRRRE